VGDLVADAVDSVPLPEHADTTTSKDAMLVPIVSALISRRLAERRTGWQRLRRIRRGHGCRS
jgi:hypothetical protein